MAGKPKAAAGKSVISLKVTLRETKPPIWRRLIVEPTMTLGDLHDAIQAAMGWDGDHLHVFDIKGAQYSDPFQEIEDSADEDDFTLGGVQESGVKRFRYTYDFGDDWEHEIVIEKTLPAEEGKAYPACVAGKRACPPEDCGGVWGYGELIDILANPNHPEREERLEWVGGEFDPEDFSVEAADAALAARFRRT